MILLDSKYQIETILDLIYVNSTCIYNNQPEYVMAFMNSLRNDIWNILLNLELGNSYNDYLKWEIIEKYEHNTSFNRSYYYFEFKNDSPRS